MREKKRKKKLYKKIAFRIFLILLIIFLIIDILIPIYDKLNAKKDYNETLEIKCENLETKTNDKKDEVEENNTIFENYKKLHSINKDMIGWIKIENTNIDQPVMFSKKNQNYYLNHSFFKNRNSEGIPFVSKNYKEENNNIIIYAHNVENKRLFAELKKYKNKTFWEKNQYIRFDTIDKEGIYQIFAVFISPTYKKSDKVFKYYEKDYNLNEKEFKEYIKNIKKMSFYDTNIEVNPNDKLITLSTCKELEGTTNFVVVAKKIKREI